MPKPREVVVEAGLVGDDRKRMRLRVTLRCGSDHGTWSDWKVSRASVIHEMWHGAFENGKSLVESNSVTIKQVTEQTRLSPTQLNGTWAGTSCTFGPSSAIQHDITNVRHNFDEDLGNDTVLWLNANVLVKVHVAESDEGGIQLLVGWLERPGVCRMWERDYDILGNHQRSTSFDLALQ